MVEKSKGPEVAASEPYQNHCDFEMFVELNGIEPSAS